MYSRSNHWFTARLAFRLPSELNKSILDSSLHRTFRHFLRFHCKCVFAKLIRFLIFFPHIWNFSGIYSFDIKLFWTVFALTTNDKSRLISTEVFSEWRLQYLSYGPRMVWFFFVLVSSRAIFSSMRWLSMMKNIALERFCTYFFVSAKTAVFTCSDEQYVSSLSSIIAQYHHYNTRSVQVDDENEVYWLQNEGEKPLFFQTADNLERKSLHLLKWPLLYFDANVFKTLLKVWVRWILENCQNSGKE